MHETASKNVRRRKMDPGDWLNAVVLLVTGLFLGIAAYGVMRSATTDFWHASVFTVLVFAVAFGAFLALQKLIDRFFPNRIRPAKKGRDTVAKPIGVLLGLPTGAVIGFLLGWLDLAKPLLDMLP